MSDIYEFCPYCAVELGIKYIDGKQLQICPSCKQVMYYDPKLTTTAIVEQDLKVLFVKRATPPGIGLWSLPGGYVDRGEIVEEAACREVFEETGLSIKIGNIVGIYSEKGNPVVLITYDSVVTGGTLTPGPEVLDAQFFAPTNLPELAFPRDNRILINWANNKLMTKESEKC